MDNIFLSICIPTCNRADVLEKCINSIIKSDIYASNEIEIVISDNASTDNTRQIVEQYQLNTNNITYYRNENNIGAEANFIKVLNLARGKFRKLHNV